MRNKEQGRRWRREEEACCVRNRCRKVALGTLHRKPLLLLPSASIVTKLETMIRTSVTLFFFLH